VETSSHHAVHRDPDHRSTVAMTTAAAADTELSIKPEMPTIEITIPVTELRQLDKTEQKRQEVINGSVTFVSSFLYGRRQTLFQ